MDSKKDREITAEEIKAGPKKNDRSSAKELADEGPQPPATIEDELDGLPLPPDGGWGWVVAFACFLANLIVDGICYVFSVIYNDLLDTFDGGKAETALVGALLPGVYLIVGPIVGALANKFGCRIVSIIGSLIAAAFFIVSSFSTSLLMVQLTYGVVGGIGFGLMYLPSIVMVGHYFDKKRALATGIAVCGSGTGTFVLAPLGSYLVSQYGWRGCNIVFAGIILNGVAIGAIYRPLEHAVRKKVLPEKSSIMQTIAAEKRRARTNSTGSSDGLVITSDNRVVLTAAAGNNNNPKEQQQQIPNKHVEAIKESYTGSRASVGSRRSTSSRRGSVDDLKRELARPFARQDALYTGSVTRLNEYKESRDMNDYVQSIVSIPAEEETVWGRTFRIVLEMFDFSLLKSPTFLVLAASGTLVFLGLYTPFVYVAQKAITQLGVPHVHANLILTVLGSFNTVSRIIIGWVADRRWIDLLIIHNVAAILAGIATALVSVLDSYALLCIYAVFFGINIAAYIALRSVVFVEMLGLKKLNNAFGLTSLFQGIAVLIGSPLSGALFDATGSYVTSFVVCGVIIAFGGVICLPVRRISAWENEREKKKAEAQGVRGGGGGIYRKVPTKDDATKVV